MSIRPAQRILGEMGDIVINFLSEKGLDPKDGSFFTRELDEIQSLERRTWLERDLSERIYYLLHGIIDQVYSMDTILISRNPAVASVSGYILLRTILEYSYKLTYISAVEIGRTERIRRSLELFYADICAYKKFPSGLQKDSTQEEEQFARKWYRDVTGGKELKRPVDARSVFDAIGSPDDEGFPPWPTDRGGKPVNPVYASGYHVGSTMAHGNLWAIKHYGLTRIGKSEGVAKALPGLDIEMIYLLQAAAGGLLQYSLGYAVQFTSGHLPASVMNQLNDKLRSINGP